MLALASSKYSIDCTEKLILTKCFMSDSHVDHDPLHDAADAEEDRKEPVYAEPTSPRHETQ